MLDASAAVELLLGTRAGAHVADRIADPDEALHAPHLIDVEVANALRRLEQSGAIGSARAVEALRVLDDLRMQRHEHAILLPRVWELQHNLTAYDAVYVALAEATDARLLTMDAKLSSAPGHTARVEVL